ncbi:MAG: hypothetical protein RLZZ143_2703 [Cyanobacteriota bacterium]|jgi:hypothetical protein
MTTVTSNDIQELKDLLSAMREETRKQIDALKEDNRQQLETLREENNKQFINLQKEITEVKIITAKIEGTIQSQALLTPKIPDLIEKFGELKNWKQIAIVAITAFTSATITWFIRGGNLKP